MKKLLLFFTILTGLSCSSPDNDINSIIPISKGTLELSDTYGGSKNDVAKSVISLERIWFGQIKMVLLDGRQFYIKDLPNLLTSTFGLLSA